MQNRNNYLNVIRLTVRLNLISQIIYRNKKTIFLRFVIKLIKVITKDYDFTSTCYHMMMISVSFYT
jgi:hypothetical protein